MRIGKIIIGFDFIIAVAVFYLTDADNLFTKSLIAAAVHEVGHILAIKICGAKINRMHLGIYGAKIEMKDYPIISYKREIIIALAGPFAGAIFGAISSFMGNYTIAGFSLILTVFNLLPGLPLDGGRALKFASLLCFDEYVQMRVTKCGNVISAILIVALCIYVCVKLGVAPSLCIFCAFTAGNFLKELFE